MNIKVIDIAKIKKIAPNAKPAIISSLEDHTVWVRYGLLDNALRAYHFLAQVLHETDGLRVFEENLNYSSERLIQVWPSRFHAGSADLLACKRNPEKLGNLVYGGRMGNVEPGDGYKFRGRGLIQITGRFNYEAATKRLRKDYPHAPDFSDQPHLVLDRQWCLPVSASFWKYGGFNELADTDNVNAVTKRLNGGLVGIKSRTEWLHKVKDVMR